MPIKTATVQNSKQISKTADSLVEHHAIILARKRLIGKRNRILHYTEY